MIVMELEAGAIIMFSGWFAFPTLAGDQMHDEVSQLVKVIYKTHLGTVFEKCLPGVFQA